MKNILYQHLETGDLIYTSEYLVGSPLSIERFYQVYPKDPEYTGVFEDCADGMSKEELDDMIKQGQVKELGPLETTDYKFQEVYDKTSNCNFGINTSHVLTDSRYRNKKELAERVLTLDPEMVNKLFEIINKNQ